MLGNFSFGDYFKRDAIHWAWEFLTNKKWLGVSPDVLSATIYLDDDEAAAVWLDEIKLPPDRLQRLGEDENFLACQPRPVQGPDGVCGPCSEIYVRTPAGAGRGLELGVHAVQPRRCSAQQSAAVAQQEHRYGHGLRADGLRAPRRGRRTITSTFCDPWSRRPVRFARSAINRTRRTAGDCVASPIMSALVRSPSTRTFTRATRSRGT